jgi:hypothetical protein
VVGGVEVWVIVDVQVLRTAVVVVCLFGGCVAVPRGAEVLMTIIGIARGWIGLGKGLTRVGLIVRHVADDQLVMRYESLERCRVSQGSLSVDAAWYDAESMFRIGRDFAVDRQREDFAQ